MIDQEFDPEMLIPWWFYETDWDSHYWKDAARNEADIWCISKHYAGNLRRFLDRNLKKISEDFEYLLDDKGIEAIKSQRFYQTLLTIEDLGGLDNECVWDFYE